MASDDDPQAAIARAIQSARYNEAVVVTVDDGASSSSRELVLVACLDGENGGIVWRDAAMSATSDDGGGAAADDIGIVRHLRTKRWALPMLNDRRRNRLYERAVRSACQEMVKRRIDEKDGTMRILDIGSGTGLLAMMGAKCAQDSLAEDDAANASTVQVTSVEMLSAMARLARMTIEENGLSGNVVVVEKHSTDADFGMDDARFDEGDGTNGKEIDGASHRKADICTSELLESGLLGEGVLPALRDAWQRHLKPDAIMVPRRARVIAVLVEGMPIENCGVNGDAAAKSTVNAATAFYGPELEAFREASGGAWLSTSSPATSGDGNGDVLLGAPRCENANEGGMGGITVPLHANAMLDEDYRDKSACLAKETESGFRGLRPLTDPTMVLNFDFASGLDALPPPTGRSIATNVAPIADGVCHGVLFWWELDLWDGKYDECTYSTEPIGFVKRPSDKGDDTDDNWQDHWQQCLYLFGDSHSIENETRKLTRGNLVELVASHDDSAISFNIRASAVAPADAEEGNRQDEEGDQDARPSQRRRLNDCNGEDDLLRQSTFNRHITSARALQLNDSARIRTLRESIQYCLDVKGHDAPLLDLSDMGICAMIAAVSGATRVTSLESSSGPMPTLAATIAQIGNGLPCTGSEFQIIQALPEHLSKEHIAGGAAEIVVAEPYYEMLEGWHLQEALNYFHLVRSLKATGAVSPSALSVPARARVMACVVEFEEFHSAYGTVDDVAGFCHASVNRYGDRYHTYDVSLPLWQYRCKRLSEESVCVATISYEGTDPSIKPTDGLIALDTEGVAHAVVFWIDYECHVGSNGEQATFSTASPSHSQTVRKLDKPIAITETDVKAGAKIRCRATFEGDASGIRDHSFSFEYIA